MLTEFGFRKSAIVVCFGIIRFKSDSGVVIRNGGEVLTEFVFRISPIVVCGCIIRFETDGTAISGNSSPVVSYVISHISPHKIGLGGNSRADA